MNPYLLLGAGILSVLLAVGGFTFGVKYQRGQEARAVLLIEKTKEEAMAGAAAAIAAQKKQTTVIKQQLETVTREVEVYRECRNTDDAMRLLNDALSGTRSESAGGSELPGAHATDR
jgi:hypothetical protein